MLMAMIMMMEKIYSQSRQIMCKGSYLGGEMPGFLIWRTERRQRREEEEEEDEEEEEEMRRRRGRKRRSKTYFMLTMVRK